MFFYVEFCGKVLVKTVVTILSFCEYLQISQYILNCLHPFVSICHTEIFKDYFKFRRNASITCDFYLFFFFDFFTFLSINIL